MKSKTVWIVYKKDNCKGIDVFSNKKDALYSIKHIKKPEEREQYGVEEKTIDWRLSNELNRK